MKPIQIRNIALGAGLPKICVPLTGATLADLLHEITLVKTTSANLVEWRVDYFEEVQNVDKVVSAAWALREALGDMPVLFTFRTKQEGGEQDISREDYLALNEALAKSGAIDLFDIELFSGDDLVKHAISVARSNKVVVVLSSHDFAATPEKAEILARLTQMRKLGADVPKIAVMPQTFSDVLTLMAATLEFSQQVDCPLITMSMAHLGCISRVVGEFSGSSLTFGSVQRASAPGQLAVEDLATVLDILSK